MKQPNPSIDRLYAEASSTVEPFRFDERVAAVFPDMINRSVPGYPTMIGTGTALVAEAVTAHSNVYDLGCSLGAGLLGVREALRLRQQRDRAVDLSGIRLIGIDNAAAMISRCRRALEQAPTATHSSVEPIIELRHCEIQSVDYTQASVVMLNFTLQFIALADRLALLRKIREGMNDQAMLLLAEKVHHPDPAVNAELIELHHRFKRDNGYSELEISQKRSALENVLLTETRQAHIDRLHQAGFRQVVPWYQQFNFVSMIATA